MCGLQKEYLFLKRRNVLGLHTSPVRDVAEKKNYDKT